MTTQVTLDETGAPQPARAPAPGVRRSGTWRLGWSGVRTVAVLELRQRVRSTRWIVALVVWFVVVGAITLLTTGALGALSGSDGATPEQTGPLLFSAVTFLVLGLGLLVTPTLTSTGINGDRNAGTLATLQVTLLSPAEIAAGKLLAAWAAACAFLVVSVPFLVLALAMGGTPAWSIVRVVLLVALLLAAVCGIGLGWSAVVARTAGSTVLTFVTVAGLVLFTPLLFGLTYPSISQERDVRVWAENANGTGCEWQTVPMTVASTERTWWLLGLNPFVVVADGAGTAEGVAENDYYPQEPLGAIRQGVRQLRAGEQVEQDQCWSAAPGATSPVTPQAVSRAPVWPWGLAANVALGVVGFVVAVRRLRVPQRTLARGTRVA
ncbi:ABC transporter permease subunit [Cellulomonas massiliensis]|uniref:ABC transporter permease subunit n=1 Tax=Cellulomonas massiliensis TaxID=1465811 RepID=UPI000303D46A|nr:ABC transporter permease subunit [Cellulomonas massiliensis]